MRRRSAGSLLIGAAMAISGAVSVTGTSATVARSSGPCPAGWTCQDVGSATGTQGVNADGSWTVQGSGNGIHGSATSESLHMVTQPFSGDTQLIAKVVSQGSTLIKPEAGIMMRASSDPRAPFFALVMFANDPSEHETQPKINIYSRSTLGGKVVQYTKVYPVPQPVWLMAQRVGNSFTASSSKDGVTWRLIPGTQHTLSLPATMNDGVFVSSSNATDIETATFAGISVGRPTITPSLPPSKHGCPPGWHCQDIDDTAPVGDQVLSAGTWTITGTGKWLGTGSEDSFNLVDQVMSGDGSITAHLDSVGTAAPTSAAGLMMRASLSQYAPYYAVLATATQGPTVSWRTASGKNAVAGPQLSSAPPMWMRIVRTTDSSTRLSTYAAFTSPDGLSWSVIPGSGATLNLGSAGTIAGLAADAVKPGGTNSAVFSSVSIQPPGG